MKERVNINNTVLIVKTNQSCIIKKYIKTKSKNVSIKLNVNIKTENVNGFRHQNLKNVYIIIIKNNIRFVSSNIINLPILLI